MGELDRWRAEAARWTYKPGTRLVVAPDAPGLAAGPPGVLLRGSALVPDVRDPDRIIKVSAGRVVPSGAFARDGLFPAMVIRSLFRDLEMHEVDEWLRRDGARVFDPHREEVPR